MGLVNTDLLWNICLPRPTQKGDRQVWGPLGSQSPGGLFEKTDCETDKILGPVDAVTD